MARFDRLTVYRHILESGLVPLFYHANENVSHKVAAAIANGGARVLEFTNRGDKAMDVYKSLNVYCEEHHPELILGVGSVLDAPTAAIYIGAGANFIVTPIFDSETSRL